MLTAGGGVDRSALTAALDALAPGVLRLKGLVVPADDPDALLVVQVVGRRTRIRPAPHGSSGGAGRSVLVVLGDQPSVDATVTSFATLGFTVDVPAH